MQDYYTEGEMYDVDPSADILPSDKKTPMEGGIKSVGGMLPGGEHEAAIYGEGYKKELEKKKKEKKDQIGVIDADEILGKVNETEKKTDQKTQAVQVGKKDLKDPDSAFEATDILGTMEERGLTTQPPTYEETLAKVFDSDKFDKIIQGYEEASKSDKAALKKIGEDYYGKKGGEAPAWAMPLMMAGLQMAASNNPDMLGAMAEGGIKGLEEHARQQKEKREDAKEKIKLEMDKTSKLIDINARNLDFKKDIALIGSNAKLDAYKIISQENTNFQNNLRAAIIEQSKVDLSEEQIKQKERLAHLEHGKDIDIINAQLEMDMIKHLDQKDARGEEMSWKKTVLRFEVQKHNVEWQKHLNLVNLEKVSTGKTTSVMMPDSDGNMQSTKIHVFLNKESGEFETKVLGFSPPDQDYIDDLTETIRQQITDSKTVTIDGKEYDISGLLEKGDMLAIEDLVTQKVQKEINAKFSTKKDIENILDE